VVRHRQERPPLCTDREPVSVAVTGRGNGVGSSRPKSICAVVINIVHMSDGDQRRERGTGASGQSTDGDRGSGGIPRRGFLRSSAAVASLGALGVTGVTPTWGSAVQSGDVPAYADFVPADDQFLSETGVLQFQSIDVDAFVDIITFQEETGDNDNQDETIPFQLSPQPVSLFTAAFHFSLLNGLGLGEEVPLAGLSGQEPPEEVPDTRTDRVSVVGDVVFDIGDYDADALVTAVEEAGLTESDTAGVFTGPDPRGGGNQEQTVAIALSSDYLVAGGNVESVQTVVETARGNGSRLHEQNSDFARLLADTGDGAFVTVRFATGGGPLPTPDGGFLNIDYSPIEQATLQGVAQSNVYDLDAMEVSATTVFSHVSTDDVDESALSGVGASAAERSVSRDGRFVTVESLYTEFPGSDGGSDDGGSDDGSGDDGSGDDGSGDGGSDDGSGDGGSDDGSGDGSTDDGSGDGGGMDDGSDDDGSGDGSTDDGSGDGSTDDGSGDGTDDGDNATDGDGGGGDGFGPGFGVLSAVASLGGAGYLLSQRLSGDTEQTVDED
jgi:hypothetical protein